MYHYFISILVPTLLLLWSFRRSADAIALLCLSFSANFLLFSSTALQHCALLSFFAAAATATT